MDTDDIRMHCLHANGKLVDISKHAANAMQNERPPLTPFDVVDALEQPDLVAVDGPRRAAWKRVGGRSLIVRYLETQEEYDVRTVSCTRARPPL